VTLVSISVDALGDLKPSNETQETEGCRTRGCEGRGMQLEFGWLTATGDLAVNDEASS
jgi:hypothetical protein